MASIVKLEGNTNNGVVFNETYVVLIVIPRNDAIS